MKQSLKFKDKVILITGAGRGLGQALAVALAKEGATLILTARQEGGLVATDDLIRAAQREINPELVKGATLSPLDLKEASHIDAFAASIYQRFGKLDMMVANAAILGPLSPISHIDHKDWQEVMQVNLTANYRLIRAFEPLLRLSPAGRALFISCEEAKKAKAFWGLYAASKAGLEAMVACWAEELSHTPIKVATLDPKPMGTKLRGNAFPGKKPSDWPHPNAYAVPACLKFLSQ